MKLLFISNVGGSRLSNFSLAGRIAARELGIDFHIACNWSKSNAQQMKEDEEKNKVTLHHIDFVRNPFHPANIKAYKQLLALMKKEKFDVVHCNTPVGGLIGRLCAKRAGIKKVIYMAHGFHFYRGAPILNWMLFYPVEWLLAQITDCIITINKEDFEIAKKFILRNNGKVCYVPGVGLDTKQYQMDEIDKKAVRRLLGINDDDILLIAMGDLIRRKNYVASIKAVAITANPQIHFLICGSGPELTSLQNLANNLGVKNQIHFLGFRTDIKDLLKGADIFLFTTFQEGLPRSLMEAMASGLPCVVSEIRGNSELIVNKKGGYLHRP